jgi:hypothetical protein
VRSAVEDGDSVTTSLRIASLVAVALFALGLLAAPTESAARLHAQPLSIENLTIPAGPIQEGHVPRPAQRAFLLDSPPVAYTTSDGLTVNVSFSDAYTADPNVAQSYVNLLGWLTHGPELNGLQVFIYTPDQVASVCGNAQAEACYWNNQMVIPGSVPQAGAPIEQVVAHEYGHHIAAHRLNTPWPAVDWGPKRWANYMNVCGNATTSSLFPGDEGAHYTLNPGEGWAEAYRRMNELRAGSWPAIGWNVVDQFFLPDATALRLINLDVTEPWVGPSVYTGSGSLRRHGVTRYVRYPYDGPVTASVTGARGTTVAFVVRGRIVRGPARHIAMTNCGLTSLTVSVRSVNGGRYHLRMTQDDG